MGQTADDLLAVEGEAELGGGLFVSLTGEFPSDAVTVLTASSLVGTFDVAFLPGLDNLFMQVQYGPINGIAGGGEGVTLIVGDLFNLIGFDDPEQFSLDALPSDVAVGDFDGGDGEDLAITLPGADLQSPGSVLVLLSNGTDDDGNWLGFDRAIQTSVGLDPSSLAAGFFNDDDNPGSCRRERRRVIPERPHPVRERRRHVRARSGSQRRRTARRHRERALRWQRRHRPRGGDAGDRR